jgi:hypothetical protein
MNMPVTKEDFVRIGKRYSSSEIINELDRLLPLATADIQALAKAGYPAALLAELTALRDRIRQLCAGCREARGSRSGARAGEDVVLEEGRNALRRGLAIATMAVSRRQPAQGESAQASREKAAELTSSLKTLRGTIGKDAAVLRTRLTTLRELLGKPDFAAAEAEAAERQAFLERLDASIATITAQAESKKSLKEQSKDRTVLMDEMDGRAYHNMRLLTQAGQAVFRDLGEKEHARMYSLRELHKKHPAQGDQPAATVQPRPSPVRPAPSPVQPATPSPELKPAANS